MSFRINELTFQLALYSRFEAVADVIAARLRPIVIVCLLGWASNVTVGQTPVRSQVEAALDSWSSRDNTRDAILKITHDPLAALITIAKSKHEPEVRRSHAIALLATFKAAPSEQALDQLADDSNPKYRCLALQSIAELKSHSALPLLIRKLDDQAVCMKVVSTNPAEEHQVYVSDEAVRLLEQITGQSFDRESANGHRATKPWKDWWSKQGATSKLPKPGAKATIRSYNQCSTEFLEPYYPAGAWVS